MLTGLSNLWQTPIPDCIGEEAKERDTAPAAAFPRIAWMRQDRARIGERTLPGGENLKLVTHPGMLHVRNACPGTAVAVSTWRKGGSIMASGKSDELKGRVKEAAGALTGDRKLKREGQTDQAVGKIKQKVEKVIDKVKDAIS
jgi:uncharacterized protein YjbJ (UPF0337 family)